jgi:rod shape-determining protein MreC
VKDFLKTSSFKVLIIAIVVLLGLIIYTASAGGSFLANLLGFASSPMQSIATEATDGVMEFLDLDGMSKDELKELILSLQQENATLREATVTISDLQQENRQLREQLEIKEDAPDTEMMAASVIGRDPSDMFYGFSIDKGSLAGISVGDPVITRYGLVGVVTQAYATTSKVSCILSEDVKVGAVCKKDGTTESGVVVSDIQLASSGLVRMEYLASDTKVEKGDIITTSGAGGNFPENLIIGEVQSVAKSDNDISYYAIVKPYEDLKNVEEVQVILNFPGKGEDTTNQVPVASPEPGENSEDAEAGK